MTESNDLAALAATLTGALALDVPPIAVSFADVPPPGVPLFQGRVPAGCRFWQEATRSTFATRAADHDLCAIGTFTHNLDATPAHESERREALKIFADLGYVRSEDLPLIPVLSRRPGVVVYGPLAEAAAVPDVALLFVRADQTLILSEASQQMENGAPPALGRPACAVVPFAANTGRTALSLGCCGARAYLDTLTPERALYAVPGRRLAAFTERVMTLARANGVLGAFHARRRRDVEAGKSPTIRESLDAMRAP